MENHHNNIIEDWDVLEGERPPKEISMFEKQTLHRNRTGNKNLLGFAILIFCLVMFGGIRSVTAKAPLPVEIGAIYNLSGSQAELDILSSRGAVLAVDQMNQNACPGSFSLRFTATVLKNA